MLNNIRRHALRSGKTVPLVLSFMDQSPHPSPVIHLEHIGHTNKQWMNDQMLETGVVPEGPAKTLDELDRLVARNRELLAKYSVRKVEHFFNDGPDGNPDFESPVRSDDAGIREVCEAIPRETVQMALRIAYNEERYRDSVPKANPADVAKK